MRSDTVLRHTIWKETNRHLETLARQVREHKSVMEAANYARWLQFSGLLEFFRLNPQPEPLLVDGERIKAQIRDLLYDCGESFRNGKADPKYASSDIAEINRKLDLLAGFVAEHLPSTESNTVETDQEPVLRVIAGGLNPKD